MNEPPYDVAVVGAGPNGLTVAAYLARAGASVLVLERRFERGGTLATDDYSTPFLYNQAQLALPLGEALPPYRDLALDDHAVEFVEPEVAFAFGSLQIGRGGAGLGAELAGLLESTSQLTESLLYLPPARAESASAGQRFDVTPDELVESAAGDGQALIVRYAAALAGFFDGGRPLGPMGALALARTFEPVLVRGGSKNLANGLFRAAARAGARCLVSVPVTGLDLGADEIEIAVADGRRFRARKVISTLDPITTFRDLIDEAPPELADIAERWQLEPTGSFVAHFGVKGGAPEGREPLRRLVGFGSLQDLREHLEAVTEGRLPDRPAGHLTVTSLHDPLQASPGPHGPLHTARFETLVPLHWPDGSWDTERVGYRRRCWELCREELPWLADATLLFQFADSPHDIERRFKTTRNGSLRQGALIPEQTLGQRPHPSCADTRTPLPGLYIGGGGVHPGLPGSLGGGYLAAGAVCEDLGLNRWWPAPPAPSGRAETPDALRW